MPLPDTGGDRVMRYLVARSRRHSAPEVWRGKHVRSPAFLSGPGEPMGAELLGVSLFAFRRDEWPGRHIREAPHIVAAMDADLLYFDDCPNWQVAERHLKSLAAERGDLAIRHHIVDTVDEAERVGFRGSPTILLNGVDPFAGELDLVGALSCRVYQTPAGLAGSPTIEQLRDALNDAAV